MAQAPQKVGPVDTRHYTRLARLGAVRPIARGLEAAVDGERLRVEAIRDDIVRLKISRGGRFDEAPTYAVAADLAGLPPAAFAVEETAAAVTLRTPQISVVIGRAPFFIDAQRADGSPLFETAAGPDGAPWAYATLNDAFVAHRRCARPDAFLGLGEKTGRLNRRGRDFTLWNNDVLNPHSGAEFTAGRPAGDPRADLTSTEFDPYYVSIPFFYHLDERGAAAGFFLDNGYRVHADFTRHETYSLHAAGGQYTEYLFAGPQIADILAGYTWLTGRTQPPPLWALGYHQCRWHRYDQADVERMAAEHRARRIPCDALWLDIDYMDGYRVFTWDAQLFPDPPAMLARLAADGFRVITIIDPGVKYEPGYPVFDEARARDLLCRTEGGDLYIGQVWPGKTAFPDFVKPEARAWWGALNAAHVQSGLAGIWNDMNEPATGDVPPGAMRFSGGAEPHERYHNQYALLMAMGTVDGLLQAMPDRRTFVLSRAGFAGIQRYAANWLGDSCARWEHLWLSMPMSMGLGLSGQAFVGADIGGFAGDCGGELLARWVQYGALTPFCRNHSETGNIDQYAWSFGPAIEQIVRDAIDLRYRLLPYLATAFMRASETGEPVQQPLVFAYQQDRAARDVDDQHLLGRDLLVAPVYTPGCVARQVYLPAGEWYDWHTGERHAGGRFIVAPTPLDRIPLYARAGAVIPMWPEAPASTAGHHPARIDLHLFVPSADGVSESLLHEDDGLSFAYRDGACYRTLLRLERAGPRLTLTATVSGAGYAEFARESFQLVIHGAGPRAPQTIASRGGGFTVEVDL